MGLRNETDRIRLDDRQMRIQDVEDEGFLRIGEMDIEKSVSAADAKRRFSQLLHGVPQRRSYVVTSHGLPIAQVSPVDEPGEGGGRRTGGAPCPIAAAIGGEVRSQDTRRTIRGCRLKVALDTDVLVYAESVKGVSMKKAALVWVDRLRQDSVVLPVQVPGELFQVLVPKAGRSPADARVAIARLAGCICSP